MHESSSQCVCGVQANQNDSSHNAEIEVVIQIKLILENYEVRFTSSSPITVQVGVFFEVQKQTTMVGKNTKNMGMKCFQICFI